MADYPKMLYREGSTLDWGGRNLDYLTVNDAEEETAARTKLGWKTHEEVLNEALDSFASEAATDATPKPKARRK